MKTLCRPLFLIGWALVYILAGCVPQDLTFTTNPTIMPAESQPTRTTIPTNSNPGSTAMPAESQPTRTTIPTNSNPGSTAMTAEFQWGVAYLFDDSIWMLTQEDQEPHVLSEQTGVISMKFSKSGKFFVFGRISEAGEMEVWSIAMDESEHLLWSQANCETCQSSSFLFSYDETRAAFLIYDQQGNTDLWVASMDGSDSDKLFSVNEMRSLYKLNPTDEIILRGLYWIPNTPRLILLPAIKTSSGYGYEPYIDSLYSVDADTGEFVPFLPEGQGGFPSFSPDGRWLTITGNDRVTLYSLDDMSVQTEIKFQEMEYSGRWHPMPIWKEDLSSFLLPLPPDEPNAGYVDYTVDARFIIWEVPLDGSEPRELIDVVGEIDNVEVSPNFATVAITSNSEITFYHVNGQTHIFPMPLKAWGISFLAWSPDSKHFAYSIGTESDIGYHAIGDLDGAEPIRLQAEDFLAGFLPGFLFWLEEDKYLFINYSPDFSEAPTLNLGTLGGETYQYDFILNTDSPTFAMYRTN